MTKRTAVDSLEKLKQQIEGNNAIAVNIQLKLLKNVNAAIKKSKPTSQKKEKIPGESQFEKKMLVSEAMCEFAGWEKGCLKSRVDVTKVIWDYATKNNLRLETNKRICVLDEKLKQLLGLEQEELLYCHIQRHIGDHLTKC
jgi:chromatin remodeling complex protein RSC6